MAPEEMTPQTPQSRDYLEGFIFATRPWMPLIFLVWLCFDWLIGWTPLLGPLWFVRYGVSDAFIWIAAAILFPFMFIFCYRANAFTLVIQIVAWILWMGLGQFAHTINC